MELAVSRLDSAIARLQLGQSLQYILYVQLAYKKNNEPVPIITAMPMQLERTRKLVTDFNAQTLQRDVTEIWRTSDPKDGFINFPLATKQAIQQGADERTIPKDLSL